MTKLRLVGVIISALLLHFSSLAQQPVAIDSALTQHIFTYGEIDCLEDPGGALTFEEATGAQFKPCLTSTPQNQHRNSAYWYRIRITRNAKIKKSFILEFFDQTLDSISVYAPGNKRTDIGAGLPFKSRLFRHKNFELAVDNTDDQTVTYYIRVRSMQPGDVIVVLRSVQFFVGYAVTEYFSFGLFYGMILIFSFYNLIMFIAMGQRQYLYYTLYNISVALYELCTDGIAYQYLWPHDPVWNRWAYSVPLLTTSVCALLFTRALLHVRSRAPKLDRLITWTIVARVAFFAGGVLINRVWFEYKFIEIVPLSLAFYTGIYVWSRGYRPARFFVVGYGFLFVGFMLKFFIMLGYTWLNFGIISYYSMSFSFIMEMFFLSFAIGDKVRLLKKRKEKAQQGMIRQMALNVKLQKTLNQELEGQVQARTHELTEANALLEEQALELKEQAMELKAQSLEISRMNALLELDNRQLQTSVKKVSQARALSAPMDFAEFSKIYPDKEACFQFLADLKWKDGYQCRKCGHEHYFNGHQPYSRRCSRCGDEESVMTGTLFQQARIPINKAFYMIFLIYSSKGKISSHKLSEILDIRQSTCWTYLDKVKKLMDERKKELREADETGWSRLVIDR